MFAARILVRESKRLAREGLTVGKLLPSVSPFPLGVHRLVLPSLR